MIESSQFVVFLLDDRRYALPLATVERIVQVVDVDPLPKAPGIVLGIVNMQGRIIPVVNVRKRFRLQERETELSDHMIIAITPRRTVALMVDAVVGVVECSLAEATNAATILPNLDYVEGVARLGDGLVLIHDLATFLSLDEEKTLEEALPSTAAR